jgi:hypothetical protein
MIAIPLILSAFTHLWNPIGFPSIFLDEGHYMRRALEVLDGLSPQEKTSKYDHPYFGQIFLAGIFKIIGYPDSLNPKPGDVQSVEMLYIVPRVLMGLLAVLDTFLVYKIADRLYDRKVAFIASILFAVMPMTWMLRRIYLDSILLPFLLSSIFFALYYTKKPTRITDNRKTAFADDNYKHIHIILLSGIFLGLAIFTKIPVFTMIPLVAYLIYKYGTNGDKNARLKTLGLWLIPVILIPAIWPVYNMLYGYLDAWWGGILWQTTERPEKPLVDSIYILLQIDPVLLVLGFAGIGYTVFLRRDALLLLWILPILVFLALLGFVSFFHFIPLVPAFCIGAGALIVGASRRLGTRHDTRKKIQQVMDPYITTENELAANEFHGLDKADKKSINTKVGSKFLFSDFLTYGVILVIGIFGLLCTTMLVTTNISSAPFNATAFVAQYLSTEDRNIDDKNTDSSDEIVIVSNPTFSWMYKNAFDLKYTYTDAGGAGDIDNFEKAIVVIDNPLKRAMENGNAGNPSEHSESLIDFMHTIGFFEESSPANRHREYPYTSMRQNFWSDSVEVKATK